MVPSWLSAHRGQIPDAAWQKRVEDWTPDVSASAWARLLGAQADGSAPRHVLLVAEDDSGVVALVLGTPSDDPSSGTAEIGALYVSPDRHRRGIGAALLGACANELMHHDFSALRVGVLTANLPARRFYEATGGHEVDHGSFDEEGHLLPVTVYEWSDIRTVVPGHQG